MTTFTDISTEDLTTATQLGEAAITMRLVGSAETDAKAALDVLLRRVHEVALDSAVREVVIDLRALEFMNSSCLNAFVTWIGCVQDAPVSSQYCLRFLSDSKKQWQGRSLIALACFAVDLIRVEAT